MGCLYHVLTKSCIFWNASAVGVSSTVSPLSTYILGAAFVIRTVAMCRESMFSYCTLQEPLEWCEFQSCPVLSHLWIISHQLLGMGNNHTMQTVNCIFSACLLQIPAMDSKRELRCRIFTVLGVSLVISLLAARASAGQLNFCLGWCFPGKWGISRLCCPSCPS